MKKEDVIKYFIYLKDEISIKIGDILYDDINKSLTFKQLQEVDHLRNNMSKIYEIISFIEREGN